MGIPNVGEEAPDFSVPDQTGKTVVLSQFKGRSPVVLYFYPKDDTPGCTVEACGFRDGSARIAKTGAAVLGVSPDSPESHRKFIEKFSLPFTLLADEEQKVCKAYGVWVKKNMYGKEYMGVARTTFVIGKDGLVKKVFEKVKPEGHVEEVSAVLKTL